MKTITIFYNPVTKTNILFDGPEGSIDDKYRVSEHLTLADLLDDVPAKLKKYNPEKTIKIYFEGYSPEEKKSMSLVLTSKLHNPHYPEEAH